MAEEDLLIADAIARLEAEDADAARDAEAAIEWLTAGEGLEVLTQERLQHFLWYGLPMKWLTDTDHHRRVAAALGRAFDLLGLPRYAELCRSEATAAVLDAYERSDAEGKKALLKADAASGIRPPDIDELQWGAVMGWSSPTPCPRRPSYSSSPSPAGNWCPAREGGSSDRASSSGPSSPPHGSSWVGGRGSTASGPSGARPGSRDAEARPAGRSSKRSLT